MFTLELTRHYQDGNVTLGIIKTEIYDPIYTMELPWRNNKTNISCVAAGTYKLTPFSGKKYQDVYQLNNVKNRSFILIHQGNFITDTKGCILVGQGVRYNKMPMLLNSKAALTYLKTILTKHKDILLTIKEINQ